MSIPTITVKQTDMPGKMVDRAKAEVAKAVRDEKDEQEMSRAIKQSFDKLYGAFWHCVVGKSFGAFGTHETRHFIYMKANVTDEDYYAVQLWKCGSDLSMPTEEEDGEQVVKFAAKPMED